MRVSVCIVTFNQAAFIEECIRSVMMQETDHALQVVVSDDRSSDATPEILAQLEAEYPETLTVIYRSSNMGPGPNFEATLAECTGEYVAFLEGDNFWTDPQKIARQVALLEANPDMAFCFHRARSLEDTTSEPEHLIPSEDFPAVSSLEILFMESNPVAFGSMLVRRHLMSEIGPWTRGLKLGDWPICIMLARHGSIGYIPAEMSRQRMHGGGVWTQLQPHTRVIYMMQMLARMAALLDGKNSELAEARLTSLRDWWTGEVTAGKVADLADLFEVLEGLNEPDFSNNLYREITRRGIQDIRYLRAQADDQGAWFTQQLDAKTEECDRLETKRSRLSEELSALSTQSQELKRKNTDLVERIATLEARSVSHQFRRFFRRS